MLPQSRQLCAVAPAVQCCSPSPAVLTALLPTPSPPCHSWDRAMKWPLNSSARGEPRSVSTPSANESRTTMPGISTTRGSEKVLSCVNGEDCTAVSHTTENGRRDQHSSSKTGPTGKWCFVTTTAKQQKHSLLLPKSFNGMIQLGII